MLSFPSLSFLSTLLPPPCPTLFPYTTLFRSLRVGIVALDCLLGEREVMRTHLGRHANPAVLAPPNELDAPLRAGVREDRKSTRLNSSHLVISYAVFCLKKKTI